MKTDELRQKYLDFFSSKDHKICASDVLVPKWDPTVLFTPAGMNPFKDHFLGNVELEFTRATSCQKCLRTGDIENVGRTAYHHTFFEMLGNFSFGDYFKRDAIHWAWEFLTDKKWLAIDPDRLTVTVYQDDDEAAGFWHNDIGLSLDRITRLGEHDNFWPAGAPTDGPDGVCGPCSEIFFHPDSGGECEIWNLVFTQFNRSGDPPNNLSPLPSRNIDTGMGLERIAAVLQAVETNFHIDSLLPILRASSEVCKTKYVPDSEDGRRLRRITDHVRACTFAIHENVLPDAEKENYTVRRLLRRAVFQGRQMGLAEPFLHKIVPAVVAAMKVPYPELAETADNVATVICQEEETFFKVIERGMKHVDRFIQETRASGQTQLDAEKVAHFYQTYGVPPELTTSVAAEFGMEMDWNQFETWMAEHGKASGGGTVGVMGNEGPIDALKQEVKKTAFVGYESTQCGGVVMGCGTITARLPLITEALAESQFIILDQTPFYAKSGGQESDAGIIKSPNGEFEIKELEKTGDMIVHYGKMRSGTIAQGDTIEAIVDSQRRSGLCRAHSATHVLHHGLQTTLGRHAQQRGSKVEADELRFDFSNDQPVTAEQLATIEQQVNRHVGSAQGVISEVVPLEQAKTAGAMMLFGEKYPDPVRMVSIGDFSKELCGGTHLDNVSKVGTFEIISEESVSAGVRRIVAYTGQKAEENQQQIRASADRIASLLSVEMPEIPNAAKALVNRLKALKKQVSTGLESPPQPTEQPTATSGDQSSAATYFEVRNTLGKTAAALNVTLQSVEQRIQSLLLDKEKMQQQVEAIKNVAAVSADDLIADGQKIGEALVVACRIDGANADLLKRLVDQIRKKASPAVILLAAETTEGKVLLIAGVSKDLVATGIKAGDIVKQVAPIVGGGGGGKPDLAQAGGKNPAKIDEAIEKAKFIVQQKLVG